MAAITTGNHPKALWPGVYAWWGLKYNEHPMEWTDLVDQKPSEKNYEEIVETTSFGPAPIKTQGGSISYDSHSQGVINRAVHVVYGLGYIVTREEIEDNLYDAVAKQRTAALAFSMRQTHETVVANVYNRAFNSTYSFGDGKELIATDHPTQDGTQSNELATAADLSEASLEALIIQIMQAKNSRGLRIALVPQSLHVHPNDFFDAQRILKSTLQSDTANNAVNALRATNALPGGIKVNHYFSDNDAWFIRTNAPDGICHFQRRPIEFTKDNDFSTENALAKAVERYSVTVGDWRSIFGTPGA